MSAPATPAARPSTTPVPQLRRMRWAVRATLTLGVAASVAANILHARANPISQAIAAWPPLALLLTVELISRIPAYRRSLGVVRLAATAAIAGIAAWVSYWHMAGVAARYGETGASPYLLPISVDGLVIVASVSLVELAGRIRTTTAHDNTTPAPTASSSSTTSAEPFRQPRLAPPPDRLAPVPAPATPPAAPVEPVSASGAAAPDKPARTVLTGAVPTTHEADEVNGSKVHEATRDRPDPAGAQWKPQRSDGHQTTPPSRSHVGDERAHESEQQDAGSSVEGGSVPSDTAAAVAYWYRRDPNLHPAQIGAKIGRSERTVRRYWPPAPERSQDTVNRDSARHLADTVRSR